MKKYVFCLLVSFLFSFEIRAQTHEVQQLLLNVEKLSHFRAILENMYEGYKILHAGYTRIKDISEGSFTLHKTFLDALLEVSPAVRKYKRVADIINYQLQIVKGHKAALHAYRESESFTPDELEYLSGVFTNLVGESAERLEELVLVLTSGSLRMSDDERLAAIDRIHAAVEDQFSFFTSFSNKTHLLALQRKTDRVDGELSKKIFGF